MHGSLKGDLDRLFVMHDLKIASNKILEMLSVSPYAACRLQKGNDANERQASGIYNTTIFKLGFGYVKCTLSMVKLFRTCDSQF